MKFDKDSAEKKRKNHNSQKAGKRVGFIFLKAFLICFAGLLVIGGGVGFGIMKGLIDSAPDISNLSVAPSEAATYIYDADGNQTQKLTASTSNRTLVSIDQIPLELQHAVVAVEDERFYEHNGIDIQGIVRAFIVGISNGRFSEGASTITQQLLKNNVFTDWTTETALTQKFKRKFQEQYLALQLEKKMDKEQILVDYLNTINLGAGAYGVQAAAHRYFNKDVSELTLSESTVIAGITQNPTQYNPIIYPEENADRRKTVLKKMLEQKYIDKAQYDEALADDVYSRIQKTNSETQDVSIYSYYVDATVEQVIEDLQEQKGYTEQQAEKLVYSGGLKIFSAQDASIQKICDEEFANAANFPAGTEVELDYALSVTGTDGQIRNYSTEMLEEYMQKKDSSFNTMFQNADAAKAAVAEYRASVIKEGDTVIGEHAYIVPQPQASCVIIDQSTGFVKAIVGGRGKKEASLTLNRATDSRRQPGSTFKVIAAYAPALDSAHKTLATVYDNAPYAYENGVEVNNWDSHNTYTGLTTIRQAITHSINVVTVKCLTDITPRLGFNYAEKLGISTLYDDTALDVRQPLALGGITDGVVNLELTAAYATIANSGQYHEPKFYTRIEDQAGNVIIDNTPVSTTILKDSTAFLLTSAMQDVVTSGTGTGIHMGKMPVAGKTGTTSDYRDIWFSGYTPYYTCSVWGGYDNHEILPSRDIYHSYHKTLWNSIMTRIHADLPVKDFPKPKDIETATVCKKSGKLAVKGLCDADPRGSQVYTEYFAKGTAPHDTCDAHISVEVCSETGKKPSATCKKTKKVFIKRPKDSEGTTDDSSYTAPSEVCPGHTIIDKIKGLIDGKGNPKIPDASTKGGASQNGGRAEEDGDTPPIGGASSGSDKNDINNPANASD
jgi:penicillin-binding protein 1A